MLLQIKTSKVCTRTEGRRSGYYDFYIFEPEAVILFSWTVWLLGQISLKWFAVRAVGNALQPQMSAINVVSNGIASGLSKTASSVDKEKLLKEYFHRRYPYAAIVSFLEKRHGVRMQVRMLKQKLKNRARKIRPVRRCFLSTFTLITCPPFIILILFTLVKAVKY